MKIELENENKTKQNKTKQTLYYRDKKQYLFARHYQAKTDMAFLHKNLGPEWKGILFRRNGLGLTKEGREYLEKVQKDYLERKIKHQAHNF